MARKRAGRGAQLSVEFLALLGAVLAIGVVLFLYADDAVRDFNSRLASAQARSAVSRTADAATRVYRQGAGARDTFWLSLPRGTRTFNASGQTIVLVLDSGDSAGFHESLPFNISGSLPASPGLLKARVNAIPSGVEVGISS